MAYHLELLVDSKIHPVFHIRLLKPVIGMPQDMIPKPLPPLSTDSHLVVVLKQIVAYRQILCRGTRVNQVLVEWLGLPTEERS